MSVATALPAVLPRTASATRQQDSGLVWSHRNSGIGTQHLLDVVQGTTYPYVFCGYGTSYDDDRSVVRVTDQWGREQSQRRGPEWGNRGYELLALDGQYVLAGVDNDTPMLVRFKNLSDIVWRKTYDGTPDGAVHAVSIDDGYALGWTDADESAGAAVVGTDSSGSQQWTDRLSGSRRLRELVSAASGQLIAVGTDTDSGDGWAIGWQSDGTRERELTLPTPGDGPSAAVVDGEALVLAGTADDGWWIQRRTTEGALEWTRTYAADGNDRGVDDLVARSDGYGLLAHDENGTVVLRTSEQGEERWRGRYAPYADSGGSGSGGPADRGHAMIPVDGDEFVIAGVTAPGEEGRDFWAARVGEPGVATPADTPEPTPTPPPTTSPPPTGVTKSGTHTSPAGDADGASGATAPGFGVWAVIAGLAGWLGIRNLGD